MKTRTVLLVVLTLLCSAAPTQQDHLVVARAYFSPDGGVQAAQIQTIRGARARVRVQAYSFTAAPIAEALYWARLAGRTVQLLVDDSQVGATDVMVPWLARQRVGIEIRVARVSGDAHDKVILTDLDTVLTGSANLSERAEERNSENIVILKGISLANVYNWQFEERWARAKIYAP